jgi:hypothetical protein
MQRWRPSATWPAKHAAYSSSSTSVSLFQNYIFLQAPVFSLIFLQGFMK